MIRILTILSLCLFVSCSHRMVQYLPQDHIKEDRKKVSEYDRLRLNHQAYSDTILNRIDHKNVKYDLESTKYLFDYSNPQIYPNLATSSWGKYLGYFSIIPLIFFGDKMINEEASIANISLSLISVTGIFYGLNIERDKNNKLIDKYNQDLKIKLNIINLPMN